MKKIFTCLFIGALFFGKTQTLHAQVNVQDSLALVDLYNSTNGPGWYNHTNWLTTKLVKSWYGVTVNNGRVSVILLVNNHLAGHIPSSLGGLTNLQRLYLYNNQLSDSIPSSFGNLSKINDLFLFNNQLSGGIPSSLGSLSKLRRLYLNKNQLSDSIPSSLGKLSNLLRLNLDHNQLSGAIPSSLSKLSNLIEMDLAHNQLSGIIPSSFAKLSKLKVLRLHNNYLSGALPSSLGKFSHLHDLDLSNNQLSGSIPSLLGKLSNLQSLYLNKNHLSGTIPGSLDSLSLTAINVNDNIFTFAGMEGLVQANYPTTLYAPQANIPLIQKNDSVLSVNAGSTLSNNKYKWYKDGVLVKSKIGDKNFTAIGAGKYNVVVTNSICKELTLYSDTIIMTGFSADKNVISTTNTKALVYPNPANNFIHLTLDKPATRNTNIVLYNMQGKAMMQQKVAAGSFRQQYSISNLAAGNYLLIIMENGKKIHEERIVIVR